MCAKLRHKTWFTVLIIIVIGNTSEGTVQNVTEDNIFNLSCIPSGSIVVFFNVLGVVDEVKGSAEIKGVLQEVWEDKIQVNNLSSLTEHPNFPENPYSTKIRNSFESTLPASRYGQRRRAYFAVPESGLYKFHISCQSACALLIEAQYYNTFMRCHNITRGVHMTAGRFYKMTVLHVGEHDSKDLQVSFTTPNGTREDPIPREYLVAYQTDDILGEFTPGNWGEWGTCHSGTQTRQRLCQNFPPVYSGMNSSYQLHDTKKCETCPTSWSLFNKYCYKLNNYTVEKNWSDARETCLNINSDLVSIKSEEEDNFVASFLRGESWEQGAWIGLQNETKVWTDGSNATYFAIIEEKFSIPTTRNCYVLTSLPQWFIIPCSTGLKHAVCKRIAFFVDNKTCLSSPLGVETGLIQDHQMRANSSYNKTTWPHFGRLAGPGAWCPKEIPYILHIKLIVLHYICAVATQGSYEQGYFATKYTLFLRTDGQGALYEDLNGNKILQGNSNPHEVHVNTLQDGVMADYVQFIVSSNAAITPCLRVEIYGRPFVNATGPTRPPKIHRLTQHPTKLYAIEMGWQAPRSYFIPGELKGYEIIFFRTGQTGRINWTLGAETTGVALGPFKRNTTFCVTILAFNEYGKGPAGDCINITTRDGACPISWTRHQNSCYLTVSKPRNWTQAKEGCLSRNSQLVTIANDEENSFVARLAANFSWIGAEWNDTISDYVWVDGSDIGFIDWWINKTRKNSSCVGICDNVSSDQLCGSSVGAWQQDECVHLKPYVCEREVAHEADNETCSNMAVGFECGLISDNSITATSSLHGKVPWKARLAGEEAWCPETNSTVEYLEVALDSLHSICALATQGLHAIGAYTTTYRLQLSIDGLKWEWYNDGSSEILQGNDNSYEVVKHNFKPYIATAQYVRVWPVSFCVHPCLRIEIYGEPTTQGGPPTGTPTNLSVEMASMTTAILTWNSLANYSTGGGEIRGFKLFFCEKGSLNQDENVIVLSTEPQRKIKNLELNTTYCVSLSAINDFGEGPRTECVELNTPSACLPGWTSYGGHCYQLISTLKSWVDAEAHCLNLNSDLVSIDSDAENKLGKSLVEQSNGCVWIGLRFHKDEAQMNKQLQWSDGSSVNFTKWNVITPTPFSFKVAPAAFNPGARKRRQSPMSDSDWNNYVCVSYDVHSTFWVNESCAKDCSFVCKRKDYNWSHQSCSDQPLGLENKAIPDSAIHSENSTSPSDARLGAEGGWCAPPVLGVYLKVDLRSPHFICAIATQGNFMDDKAYVEKYQMELAVKDFKGEFYKENGNIKMFEGNENNYHVKKNTLQPGVVAVLIRLRPTSWYDKPCLRLEVYGESDLERVPTHAPENVLFSITHLGLEVTWDPLPVYFHGYVLDGYTVEIWKTDNILLGAYSQAADSSKVTIAGIKEEDRVACVAVNGFTKYGDGPSSGCAFEEHGLDPPSNLTKIDSTPTSFVIQWSAYTGNVTLLGYQVLVLREDDLKKDITVAPNTTTAAIEKLAVFTEYCIQIRLIAAVADGTLSDCFFVSTDEYNGWSTWGAWGECSRTCGQGVMSRRRMCYGNATFCDGINSMKDKCIMPSCPACQDALGMESGEISDGQINASTEWSTRHAAIHGRLHLRAEESKAGAWTARTRDANQWLQIDLIGQDSIVTRVATQGRNRDHNQWVTKYQLHYSNNTVFFLFYTGQERNLTKDFAGNTDRDTVVPHYLNPPITARYIRFRPVRWHEYISMRVELYGCQGKGSGNTGVGNNGSVWTSWSEWSTCSKSCDEGLQFRNRTCLSPSQCTDGQSQEEKACNSHECIDFDPPSNVTKITASSSSVVIGWSPYSGNATLLGYRVLVLDQGRRGSRKKRAISQLEGELIRNFTVGPNTTAVEIENLSAFSKYCIRILVITEENGNGKLSECVYFYTKENTTTRLPPPKSSATSDGSSSVTVQWEPLSDLSKGLIRGYIMILHDTKTTVLLGPCLTNTTVISSGCIEVAAFTVTGLGNTTGCLSIEKAPEVNETAPKISASIKRSLTSIKVTWDPKTISGVKGDINGFSLVYEPVRVNGILSQNPVSTRIVVCSNYTEYLLTDLSPFAQYKIKMAALTTEGNGKFSDAVYGETCACAEFITVTSRLNVPDSELDSITSELTKVISRLLIDTCGECEEYNKTKLVYSNESQSEEFVFPVTKTSYGHSAYSKFIPVIQVPGVVVVTRKGDLSMILTEVASGSVLQSWPISVVTILMAMLAGIIIWFLDSRENSEQFPRQFIKGVGEGFWWSFISMTTVGYGDLCPKSVPAKIFAMVWFLVGLVIFSVFMGALASLLTVTTVKQTIGSPSGKDTKTVAVVADSPEKRVALGTLSGKLNVGKTFPDVKHLVEALKDGTVESILVDMYTPVKRKDLFNGSWFEVAKLLEAEISHGVLLQGSAVGLAEELEKLIKEEDVQTGYLQEENGNNGEEEDVEEEPVTFFDPSSPYYLATMYASAAGLAVFLCCGILYQALCYNKISGTNRINPNTVATENTITRANMETAVEEFYKSFSATYQELRRKCKAELKQLAKLKRQGSRGLKFNRGLYESQA